MRTIFKSISAFLGMSVIMIVPAVNAQWGYDDQENIQSQNLPEPIYSVEPSFELDTQTNNDFYFDSQLRRQEPAPSRTRADQLRRQRMQAERRSESAVNERLEQSRLEAEEELYQSILSKSRREDRNYSEAEQERRRAEARLQAERLAAERQRREALQYEEEIRHQQWQEQQMREAQVVTRPEVKTQAEPEQISTISSASQRSSATAAASTSGQGDVSIYPLVGVAVVKGDAYDVSGKGSFGIGLGYRTNDQLEFGLGYLYSGYDIRYRDYFSGYMEQEYDAIQHTVDFTANLRLLEPDASFQPFVGGGLSYTRGTIESQAGQQGCCGGGWGSSSTGLVQTVDYDTFGLVAQGGVDFSISRNLSIGSTLRYVHPLSSNVGSVDYGSSYYGSSYYGSSYQGGLKYLAENFSEQSVFHILASLRYRF